jgi:DNA end-binding protein Ku
MATQLIDALAGEWKPEQYHDTFTEELRSRIEAKDAGKEIVEAEPEKPEGAQIVDLMAALEASVQAAKGGGRRKPRSRTPRKRPARAS